jgi:hypothetical protein
MVFKNKNMKTFDVDVKMEQQVLIRVQAETVEEAIKLAKEEAVWFGWNEHEAKFKADFAYEVNERGIPILK